MAVLEVMEVLAESDKSWEDAARQAVFKADPTVHDIRSVYIQSFEAAVDKGQIVGYRISAKISFVREPAS